MTQYILTILKPSINNLSFKNIQRRVYDAINVMHAIGLLDKDKNNLYYKGNFQVSNGMSQEKQVSALKAKSNNISIDIIQKQKDLITLCSKVYYII